MSALLAEMCDGQQGWRLAGGWQKAISSQKAVGDPGTIWRTRGRKPAGFC